MAIRASQSGTESYSPGRETWYDWALEEVRQHAGQINDPAREANRLNHRAQRMQKGRDETQLKRVKSGMGIFRRISFYMHGISEVTPTPEELVEADRLRQEAIPFEETRDREFMLKDAATALAAGLIREIADGPILQDLKDKIASGS